MYSCMHFKCRNWFLPTPFPTFSLLYVHVCLFLGWDILYFCSTEKIVLKEFEFRYSLFCVESDKACICTCCFLQVFGFITTVVLGVETYFLLMSLRRDHAPSDNKVLNMLGVPPSNSASPQSPDYDPESVPDTKYWRATITCNSESFIVRFLGISTIQTDHCKCLCIALNSSIVVVYPCKVCNCTGSASYGFLLHHCLRTNTHITYIATFIDILTNKFNMLRMWMLLLNEKKCIFHNEGEMLT